MTILEGTGRSITLKATEESSEENKEVKTAERKMGAMEKVRILAIVFSIFLIGCSASGPSFKPRTDPEGFRGIQWGTEISTLKDMDKVEQDKSSNHDLVWYTRKGDPLTLGQARLENIFYSFWMGNFESVWIGFGGDENFETLKKELFEQFGKVLESEELMKKMDREAGGDPAPRRHAEEFYAWWGKNTELTLSYSRDRHKGTLTINSKKMGEERRAHEKQKRK